MSSTRPTPGLLAWALLCLLGLLWGASFLGVELALQGFKPLTIAAIRISLAAVILLGASVVFGPGLPALNTSTGRRTWLHCLGMALFSNVIPFTLLSWGQMNVTSGFAGITMAVVPLLILPLAHFFVQGEQMTLRKAAGFLVGFTGVLVLIGPATILTAASGDLETMARFACIGASCCYATGSIITRRTPPGPLLAFSAAALLLGALIITPIALISDGVPAMPETSALLGVVYLGLFPTAFATLLLVHVIKTAGPSFLSLVNYQVPVWAVLIGMTVLGEPLPGQFVTALALILAGLALAQARLWRFRP